MCAWYTLGLALLDGPDPTALLISSRLRTVRQLCGLAQASSWQPMDSTQAADFGKKVEAAAQHCEAALESTLAQRKRLKIPKLPLHKELGELAYDFVQSLIPAGTHMGTQWSNVLKLEGRSNDTICKNRRWPGMLRKVTRNCGRRLKALTLPCGPQRITMHLRDCCRSS